jgi:hypothetical protein
MEIGNLLLVRIDISVNKSDKLTKKMDITDQRNIYYSDICSQVGGNRT